MMNSEKSEPGLFGTLFAAIKGEQEAAARLKEWAEIFAAGQRYLDDELPAILLRVLKDSSVLPHPSLGLPHLMEVVEASERGGNEQAVSTLLALNRAVLDDRFYREQLEERWRKSPRWPVMHDALRAHDGGLYGASVPAALAQTEGLIADATRHRGQMPGAMLRQRARELASRDDFINGRLLQPFLDELLVRFGHGEPECPPFSRHAILHGGDFRYGTWENSVRALTWFDVVLALSEAPANENSTE